jgi:hypothetical protein
MYIYITPNNKRTTHVAHNAHAPRQTVRVVAWPSCFSISLALKYILIYSRRIESTLLPLYLAFSRSVNQIH